jgi:hypothetical protein
MYMFLDLYIQWPMVFWASEGSLGLLLSIIFKESFFHLYLQGYVCVCLIEIYFKILQMLLD